MFLIYKKRRREVVSMTSRTLFVDEDPVAEKRAKRLTVVKRVFLALVPCAALAAGYFFLWRPFFR